jgi:hypothetical protein
VKTNIIIAGTRTYSDYTELKQVCSDYVAHLIKDGVSQQNEISIISGMASGADSLGVKFAKESGLCLIECAADWDAYGKAAGYRRNDQMAKLATDNGCGVLLAFWDGKSKGTKHMIELAEKHKMEIYITLYKE